MELINDFSFGLFFWQALVLIVLIFLLRKFAWKPILESLNKREQGIQEALDSAEHARKEMQSLQANNEQMMQEARAERDAMLKEAQEVKKKMIEEASQEAKEKGDQYDCQSQRINRKRKEISEKRNSSGCGRIIS